MEWYVVQVHSNYELKAKQDLLDRIEHFDAHDKFGEILIPTEQVTKHSTDGKTRKRTKAVYPGYMFVEMEMTDEAWHIVKGANKVTTFIGNQKPQKVSLRQIEEIRKTMAGDVAKPKIKPKFTTGEKIRITSGAFANFTGIVQELLDDKQKVKVCVNIFGRETPVELAYTEVSAL